MRVLCLHGQGTSAEIMRRQLDAFMREADASYEFIFLEGEHEYPPAPGIGEIHQGPTCSWMTTLRPYSVRAALDHIDRFVAEDGPFDGIIGFSQGGSVALSYLLEQVADASSDSDSSFEEYSEQSIKWAVFFSAIPAFSPDLSFCEEIYTSINDSDRTLLEGFPLDNTNIDFEALSGPEEKGKLFESFATFFDGCMAAGVVDSTYDHGFDALKQNFPGAEGSVPRIVHPDAFPGRLRIPTVHVIGAKDQPGLIASSNLVKGACEPGLVQSLVHSGGHEIPRTAKDVRALVRAVERAARDGMDLGS